MRMLCCGGIITLLPQAPQKALGTSQTSNSLVGYKKKQELLQVSSSA